MKYLIIFLLCIYGLSSCSTGPRYEVEIQMDCSVVIKELRRGNSVEVNEVLKATYAEDTKDGKEFIALFLTSAKRLYPKKPFREYFKFFKGVGPGATDAQVRKGLYQYRSKLIADLKNQLSEELSDFGVESIDGVKGKDVLKIVCSSVDKLDVLKAKFSRSNFLRIYEVAVLSDLSVISPEYFRNPVGPKKPYQDTLNNLEIEDLEDFEMEEPLEDVVYNSGAIYVKKPNLEGYLSRMNVVSSQVLFVPSYSEVNFNGEMYFEVSPCLIPKNKTRMITDRDLKVAVAEVNKESGSMEILITMTEKGSVKFAKLSGENIGKKLAIVINDRAVISAPVVNGAINGGQIAISGAFTKNEADELAAGLNVKNWRIPCSISATKKIR